MKKIIFIFILLFTCFNIFSQAEIQKKLIKNLDSGKMEKEISRVSDKYNIPDGLAVGDQYFWEGPSAICFDENNNLIIFDQIALKIYVFNAKFECERFIAVNKNNLVCLPNLIKAYSVGLLLYNENESIILIDWNGNIRWEINLPDDLVKYSFIYDEKNDLLFHYSKDGIYLLKEKNSPMKNEQINDYLSKAKISNIRINDENKLVMNNVIEYIIPKNSSFFIGKDLAGNSYYVNNRRRFLVQDSNAKVLTSYKFAEDEYSISRTYFPALSKTGDLFYLDYSNEEKELLLYCIENIWSPEAKQKWNPSNSLSETIQIGKVFTTVDNLRLRAEEITSSKIITTMAKGTKVRIIKLGKAETIDGINSNWVQIEVLTGSKDKDGKEIKSGTIGWCYGGYLE